MPTEHSTLQISVNRHLSAYMRVDTIAAHSYSDNEQQYRVYHTPTTKEWSAICLSARSHWYDLPGDFV